MSSRSMIGSNPCSRSDTVIVTRVAPHKPVDPVPLSPPALSPLPLSSSPANPPPRPPLPPRPLPSRRWASAPLLRGRPAGDPVGQGRQRELQARRPHRASRTHRGGLRNLSGLHRPGLRGREEHLRVDPPTGGPVP